MNTTAKCEHEWRVDFPERHRQICIKCRATRPHVVAVGSLDPEKTRKLVNEMLLVSTFASLDEETVNALRNTADVLSANLIRLEESL